MTVEEQKPSKPEPEYSKQAANYLSNLDKPTKRSLKKAIEGIPKGDIVPLKGYDDGRKRLRKGKYRVIFIGEPNKPVKVLNVGARGDIYK